MFNPTHNATSTQRVSPPKRGAVEPVNLKTHRNPAKTAQSCLDSYTAASTFLPGFLVFSKSARAIVWADGFGPFAETKGQIKKP
jgi:hypothetical protein